MRRCSGGTGGSVVKPILLPNTMKNSVVAATVWFSICSGKSRRESEVPLNEYPLNSAADPKGYSPSKSPTPREVNPFHGLSGRLYQFLCYLISLIY